MSMENDQGSFYDGFAGHEVEMPRTTSNVGEHANRADISKPYVSNKYPEREIDNTPKTCHNVSWWRFFTGQQDNNIIANQANRNFTKSDINGDNYESEKQRYFKEYADILNKL